MNALNKTLRGIAALGTLALLGMGTAANAATVSYFNFNLLTSGSAVDVTTIAPAQGNGSLVTNFNAAGVTAFAGTTLNAEGADPAGQALALTAGGTAFPNNGGFLEYRVNTTGFSNLALSFAIQKSATGFNNDSLSVSANGGTTYTSVSTGFNPPTAFATRTIDLSAVSALNNNPNVRFRFFFDGASASAGNNRIDNLKVTTAPPTTPAPSSVLVALVGVVPGAVVLRKRRK